MPGSRASKYDENGFLLKTPPPTKDPDGFDVSQPPPLPASNGSAAVSRPAEFGLGPQEFTFGPSSEDRFTRGRKLGSTKGEDFWSDRERPAKPSWDDGPGRKDPFSETTSRLEELPPKRRTPRTAAIRPDHIDPSSEPPRADSPGTTQSAGVIAGQAPERGGLRPRRRGSNPDFESSAPATVPSAIPPVDEVEQASRQVRKSRHREPEPDPDRTDFFGPTDERKLSRRERKQRAVIEQQQQQSLGQWFKEITLLGVVAIGTAILLTTYLVQAFFIPSISMENTLLVKDRVLVNKAAYKFSEPASGDIIVFISPDGNLAPPPPDTPYGRFMDKLAIGIGLKSSEQDLIKRVVATSGQTIEVKVGVVFVDGKQIPEPYRKDDNPMQDLPATVVPEDSVFVLGDNRGNSGDSRLFGPVEESKIIGKAFARIWPMERIQILK